MNLENISRYISTGSIFDQNPIDYRKQCWVPAGFTALCGIVPGVVLKSYWLYMTFAMCLISIACVWVVYATSAYGLTMKEALWLDVVVFGGDILVISILGLMFLTIWKDFNPWMLLIFSPPILIPLFVGIKIRKVLKSEEYNPKKAAKSNIGVVGFACGILGMNFAAIFRNVEQSTAFIVVLVCLSILNSFMSLGLLSLHKLYYMKKYKINL